MIWRVLQNVLNHLFGTRRPSMKAAANFRCKGSILRTGKRPSRDPQQSVVKIEIVDGAQEELIAG